MSKTMERSVVSADNYAEVKNMLLSNDESSTTLALSIMEKAEYSKSEIFILCLLKETFEKVFGRSDQKKFEEQYEELFKSVTGSIDKDSENITSLSFRSIYELAVKRAKKEELEFMMDIFKEELITMLKNYGFTFLEYLDITIKPKKV